MVMETLLCVILLLGAILILILLHLWIVRKAFSRDFNNADATIPISVITTPSMSPEDIKKLPNFDYKVESRENMTLELCAVCLENFKVGEKCRLLPNCNHSFHAQCVDSWLLKTAACPICRIGANSPETARQSSISREVGVELT